MPRGQRRSERKNKMGSLAAAAAERAERTAVFGKTKMCKFYILGLCAKGKDCCFAHDPSEMNPAPDLSCTKLCKALINTGYCDNPSCKYAHRPEEVRPVPSEMRTESTPKGKLDLSSKISEPTGPHMAHPMIGCVTRQGYSGFRPIAGQAAAVTLADVLRHGFMVSGDQKQSAFSAEHMSPHHGYTESCSPLNAPYNARALGGSISREYSCTGPLPQHDPFQVLYDMRSNEGQCDEQFVSSSRRANLAGKSKVHDMSSQVSSTYDTKFEGSSDMNEIKDYERQISDASTASSDGAMRLENNHTSDDDFDKMSKSNEGGPEGSDEHSLSRTSDVSDAAGLVVKNTFLEFVREKPFVGLRSIQTAAGRLESLGEE